MKKSASSTALTAMIASGHILINGDNREPILTNKTTTVLVTGASGFIAKHCIVQLLEQGYRVRGTVRTAAREAELRTLFAKYVDVNARLEFAHVNLLEDAGWDTAVEGCDYVMHIASPVPSAVPQSENDVVRPAVEGTIRVLKAAASAGVKRVILTSSVAAISAGLGTRDVPFNESNWSDLSKDLEPYPKSKTMAERAAWDFVEKNGSMELSTINPVMVIGPLLDSRYSTPIETVRQLLLRKYPGTPRLGWTFVDVRDVAAAHILAMTMPDAAGKRFICSQEFAWMNDIARVLNKHFARHGYRVSTLPLPDWTVRLVALFDPLARVVVDGLGVRNIYDNSQLKEVLNWQPRPLEESIVATGRTLIEFDLV
jgi:dihydroflavonol-4-reductase